MTSLPPRAQQLLARAKVGQRRASPDTRLRVRAAVSTAITAEASQPSAADANLPAGARRWVARGLDTLMVLALSAAGVLVITALSLRLAPPEPRPAVGAPRVEREQPPRAVAPAAPPTMQSPPAPATAASDLLAEMKLLAAAEAALRANQPERAIDALRMHRAQFEHGQLREERTGLHLIARCALGQDVGGAVEKYLATAPHSVLRARVVEACGARGGG